MRKEKVSVKMENLDCVIGKSTKKYNTVTMRVDRSFILEALDLYESEREGRDPGKGLVGVELVAVYQDEVSPEQMELPIEEGEPVTGDELVDGAKDYSGDAFQSRITAVPCIRCGLMITSDSESGYCGNCESSEPILTTAVKDQDAANEAFDRLGGAIDEALGIGQEE